MSLRPADSYAYAAFRSSLADTDSNALFEDGSIRPVLIKDKGMDLYIEHDYRFYSPEKFPGFVRFELRPEEIEKQKAEKAAADAAEAARSHKLKGRNWTETMQDAQQTNLQARAERYSQEHPTDSAGDALYNRRASAFEEARQKHSRGRI